MAQPGVSSQKTAAFQQACISASAPLSDALQNLNETGFRTVLVVDEKTQLLGIVTDQDIRKALLKGTAMTAAVSDFMNPHPIVGEDTMDRETILGILMSRGIETLPILNTEKQVVDFVRIRDFVVPHRMSHPVVVMAGGFGKRLGNLTQETPKPLLTVGNRPILGHILDHLAHQGFQHVFVTTHYRAEQIHTFIDSHAPVTLSVQQVHEEEPLGTAGALKKMDFSHLAGPLFVMNGDILTRLDFQEMLHWHQAHGNTLTVATRSYQAQIPYGVVHTEGQQVVRLEEKPAYAFSTNAGIYVVDPSTLSLIPDDTVFHMTDLIEVLLGREGQKGQVGVFPLSEPWIDIGQPTDFAHANQDYRQYVPKETLLHEDNGVGTAAVSLEAHG